MRSSLRYRLPLASLLIMGAGCMGPEYPDDFVESTQSSSAVDGGAAATGPIPGPFPRTDAGASTGGNASSQPGLPEAGSGTGQPIIDASTTGPGLRDASARDASIATTPEASVAAEAGTDADTGNDQGPSGTLASCTITASTDASDTFFYAGQYGCAVWIGDAASKLVKTFFLATKIASRSGVSTFQRAASGMTVDAVAGATLRSAKQHQYMWDLKDAKGATVPSGKYTLNIETHSSNGDTTVSVPFDTSMGEVTEMGTPKDGIRSASIDCK